MDHPDPNKNKDWTFVEQYQQNHGALDWKAISEIGKQKDLFSKYGTWKSAKAAYYRAKAKRHPWFGIYLFFTYLDNIDRIRFFVLNK